MRAKLAVNKSLARERALQERLNSLHAQAQGRRQLSDEHAHRSEGAYSHSAHRPAPTQPPPPPVARRPAPPLSPRRGSLPTAAWSAPPSHEAAPHAQRAVPLHADAHDLLPAAMSGGGSGSSGGRVRVAVAWEQDENSGGQPWRRGGAGTSPLYDGGQWARAVPRDSLRPLADGGGRGEATASVRGAGTRVAGFGLPEAGLDAGDAVGAGRAGIPPRPPRPSPSTMSVRASEGSKQQDRKGAALAPAEAEADVWELAASLRILAGGGHAANSDQSADSSRMGRPADKAQSRAGIGAGTPSAAQRSGASGRETSRRSGGGDGLDDSDGRPGIKDAKASGPRLGMWMGGVRGAKSEAAALLLQRVVRGRLVRAWVRSLPEWRQVLRAGQRRGVRGGGGGGLRTSGTDSQRWTDSAESSSAAAARRQGALAAEASSLTKQRSGVREGVQDTESRETGETASERRVRHGAAAECDAADGRGDCVGRKELGLRDGRSESGVRGRGRKGIDASGGASLEGLLQDLGL